MINKTIIALDGACRGNGSIDCLSTGAIYIVRDNELGEFRRAFEKPSTNQRGELHALILALEEAAHHLDDSIYIVSDSEYIVNCMNKEWYKNWMIKGWVTASNEPVKNRDLWEQVVKLMQEHFENADIAFYHVKGHVLSVGKVTARKLIEADSTCALLLEKIIEKYANVKKAKYDEAWNLFIRNNGFEPPEEVFRGFICLNTVVDYVASLYADDLQYI